MFTGTLFNLQITFRVLARGKAYTIINLTGLVLGLTATFFLFIFAINELSYNKSYPNSGRIFRVICNDSKGNKQSLGPFLLKPDLKKKFPEIEETSRMVDLSNFTGKVRIKSQNTFREAPDFVCADPEILKIFSIKIIRRGTTGLLEKPNRILISEKKQKEFFGNENSIGKILIINTNGQYFSMIVEGVFQNLPWNSTFKASIITTIAFYTHVLQSLMPWAEEELKSGNDNSVETYIMLKPGVSMSGIEQKIKLLPGSSNKDPSNRGLSFQNLKNIYLNSTGIYNDFSVKSSKENLLIYLSLAFFILLLTGINYSILSTARSALRFREIGMRKVLGATKRNLRSQLLTESLLLTLLALPFVFILLGLVNPFIESIYGNKIAIHTDLMLVYICVFSFFTLSIGVVSGLYISIYLLYSALLRNTL
jgi:putative ABC transport system permease protein